MSVEMGDPMDERQPRGRLHLLLAWTLGKAGDGSQCAGIRKALEDALLSGNGDLLTVEQIQLPPVEPARKAETLRQACREAAARAQFSPCIVVLVAVGADLLEATASCRREGVYAIYCSHQLPAGVLESSELPQIIAVPAAVVDEGQAQALRRRTQLVLLSSVPHPVDRAALEAAAAGYAAAGRPPLPPVDEHTAAVLLGGDAPDESGCMRRFSAQDARNLARRISSFEAGGSVGQYLVTNSPRTGCIAEDGSPRDPDPHRSGAVDDVTQAFVDELARCGGVPVHLFDFQHACRPSAYLPILHAFAAAPWAGRIHIGGDSVSTASEATAVYDRIVIHETPSMNPSHLRQALAVGAPVLRLDGTVSQSGAHERRLPAAVEVVRAMLRVLGRRQLSTPA
jgi:hypothetical protein